MDTKEMILEILNSTNQLKEDISQSKLKRLWKDIPSPFCSIQEALDHLSKDELSEIRRYHDLRNMSTLKKKDLVIEIAAKLPQLLEKFAKQVDDERYQLFKRISQNDGILEVDIVKTRQLETWRKTGFIFSASYNGQKLLFMPHEILEAFRALEESALSSAIHRNTNWILLTHGMLYFYGVMEYDEISDEILDLTGERPDTLELLSILLKACEFYGVIQPDPIHYWSYGMVNDPTNLLREHNTRSDIAFASFSKDEIILAGDPEYIHEDHTFKRFQSFLMKEYNLTPNESKRVTYEAQQVIKANISPTAVIDYLSTQLKFPTYEAVQRLADEAMYLTNNTHQWTIKGHTPSELHKEERDALQPLLTKPKKSINKPITPNLVHPLARKHQKVEKIGRNAPCPCGSGKKHKHCCGR